MTEFDACVAVDELPIDAPLVAICPESRESSIATMLSKERCLGV